MYGISTSQLISVYSTGFYISLGVAIFGLVMAVFFFFYFDIPTVFALMTGRIQKKTIERMEKQSAKNAVLAPGSQSGSLTGFTAGLSADTSGNLGGTQGFAGHKSAENLKTGGAPLRDFSETQKIKEGSQKPGAPLVDDTTVLDVPAAETTVLNTPAEETTLLSSAEPRQITDGEEKSKAMVEGYETAFDEAPESPVSPAPHSDDGSGATTVLDRAALEAAAASAWPAEDKTDFVFEITEDITIIHADEII